LDGASITSMWTRRAVWTAAAAGLEAAPILDELGISRALLDDPSGRVPFMQHARVVDRLASALDDPGIGIDMGARANAGDFGVVSLLAESRPTLRGALDSVQRFNALANQASRMSYRVERGRTIIRDADLLDGRPAPPAIAEATLAFYATMMRKTIGVAEPLIEVWLAHPRHRGWTAARAAHFGAKVRDRQPYNALVVRSELLDAHFRSARPELSVQLETLAHTLEGRLAPAGDTVARVSAFVRDQLAHGELPPIAPAARALGTSARSLQRELERAGMSYRDVVDGVRRDAARELLEDRSATLETVAAKLGYEGPRALRRACLRWFGRTPGRRRAGV
jgi:AraC-like DNA-binding protein